jgi:flavin-dependent dehydrogenase
MMTFGYRQRGQGSNTIELKFYPGFPGYLWVFPRPENVSYGICGKLDQVGTGTLKAKLHDYLRKTHRSSVPKAEEHGRVASCELYGAMVPSLRPETLKKNVISGRGWALLGDAAGFADPITAEGIYYALRSGQLLAEALKTEDADSYAEACRIDFVSDFISGAEFFDRFYAGNFLGSSFINRMIQIASHSTTLRKVVNAFVAGQQPYRTLRTALLEKAPKVAGDMLLSVIASSFS